MSRALRLALRRAAIPEPELTAEVRRGLAVLAKIGGDAKTLARMDLDELRILGGVADFCSSGLPWEEWAAEHHANAVTGCGPEFFDREELAEIEKLTRGGKKS